MAAIELTLSDAERQHAEARAVELGYASVEEYVCALIASDVEAPVSDAIEAELVQALSTPARELTPADWERKRQRLIEQHRQAKAG